MIYHFLPLNAAIFESFEPLRDESGIGEAIVKCNQRVKDYIELA